MECIDYAQSLAAKYSNNPTRTTRLNSKIDSNQDLFVIYTAFLGISFDGGAHQTGSIPKEYVYNVVCAYAYVFEDVQCQPWSSTGTSKPLR
jgi:hypothetical protein